MNGPTQRDVEERERFWNDLDRVVDRIGNGHRLGVLGDLNGWVGHRLRLGINGGFGIPRENDNGRRVQAFCTELCVSNTYFEHNCLHKYTRVARGQF